MEWNENKIYYINSIFEKKYKYLRNSDAIFEFPWAFDLYILCFHLFKKGYSDSNRFMCACVSSVCEQSCVVFCVNAWLHLHHDRWWNKLHNYISIISAVRQLIRSYNHDFVCVRTCFRWLLVQHLIMSWSHHWAFKSYDKQRCSKLFIYSMLENTQFLLQSCIQPFICCILCVSVLD